MLTTGSVHSCVGWVTCRPTHSTNAAIVQVAMAFVPSRQVLFERLGGSYATLKPQILIFVEKFGNILNVLTVWLVRNYFALLFFIRPTFHETIT